MMKDRYNSVQTYAGSLHACRLIKSCIDPPLYPEHSSHCSLYHQYILKTCMSVQLPMLWVAGSWVGLRLKREKGKIKVLYA